MNKGLDEAKQNARDWLAKYVRDNEAGEFIDAEDGETAIVLFAHCPMQGAQTGAGIEVSAVNTTRRKPICTRREECEAAPECEYCEWQTYDLHRRYEPYYPISLEQNNKEDADFFARERGADIRFVSEWRGWAIWHETAEGGGSWKQDGKAGELILAEAHKLAAAERKRVWNHFHERDGEDEYNAELRDARKAAKRWGSDKVITPMLKFARGVTALHARAADFDATGADPAKDTAMLLNAANGIIDLRTGQLMPPDRKLLITRQAPIAYNPTAKAPRWERFINEIMLGIPERVAYLRRVLGQCITGDMTPRKFYLAYGRGGNGKSVLLNVVAYILGDYARFPAPNTFEQTPAGMKRGFGLAGLAGARLAVVNEFSKRLDIELVKRISGAERAITAEQKGKDEFEFRPACKLIFTTNQKPTLGAIDDGLIDRLAFIPFEFRPAESQLDSALERKLIAEAPGILAWLVSAAREWYLDASSGGHRAAERALLIPEDCAQRAKAYIDGQDIIGCFIRERLILGPIASSRGEITPEIGTKELYAAYKAWCEDAGLKPMPNTGPKNFPNEFLDHTAAREAGIVRRKGTDDRWRYIGVTLRDI